jgi:DNA-binding IclR family transcriptional regulator
MDRLRLFPDGLSMIELARGLGLKRDEVERSLKGLRCKRRVRRDCSGVWYLAGRQGGLA